jgi:hypothetical protein
MACRIEVMMKDLEVLSGAEEQCMKAARSIVRHRSFIDQLIQGTDDTINLNQFPPWDECVDMSTLMFKLSTEARRRIVEDDCTIQQVKTEWKEKIYREVQKCHRLLCQKGTRKEPGDGELTMERRPSF